MTDRARLEISLGSGGEPRGRGADSPLRSLVLASLSGSGAGPDERLVARRVSAENFDARIADLKARVELNVDGKTPIHEEIFFRALDDFHPDHLLNEVDKLQDLLDLSRRLDNQLTEKQALLESDRLFGPAPAAAASAAALTASAPPQEDREQLFARLLGQRPGGETHNPAKQKVQSLIREALGPVTDQPPSSSAQQRREDVLDMLAGLLRAVLTQPDLRNLERAWRSVHWLVSRLDDDQAEVYVADLPKESLRHQLHAHTGNLEASPLYALLSDRTQTAKWDLIVADYTFHLDREDLVLLATVGAIAARIEAPLLTHGDLSLCGCRSPAEAERPWDWTIQDSDLSQLWTEVRQHPAAQWLGVATPRFLLRQPFGKYTDPIDSFPFEELPVRPDKERFLWGNPAFACAHGMAAASTTGARQWPLASATHVTDLPVPVYEDGSGQAVQPPLELLLTERSMAAIERGGLIAFAGGMNADYIAASRIGPLSDS
jgi:type VI secretion system protein ImpC